MTQTATTTDATSDLNRNRVPHMIAGAMFGVSSFLLAVLLNLHWPDNGEGERSVAIGLALLCLTAWGVMHLAKPEETRRTTLYVLLECAFVTLLMQTAFHAI